MRPRSLAEVADEIGGALTGSGEPVVRGAVVDSRSATAGDLFFALPGDRHDGHGFVADALARGAVGAVVSTSVPTAVGAAAGSLIGVADPAVALMGLAAAERARMDVPVVGITGSTGKTCTKDLITAVLGVRLSVTGSPASFNNEVGLPLTLLASGPETQAVVCEMGARGRGHIRRLCEVARPTIGVVTNVGVAHLGLFGSVEAIRDAKAELPESLPPHGVAVLNADDPVVGSYRGRTVARVVTFGTDPAADVRAEAVTVDGATGRATFLVVAPEGRAEVRLRVPGEHMVPNALAAAAVGLALGLTIQEVAGALARATVSAGRMEVFVTAGGVRVIDDAYNANPTSMAAALKALRSMAGRGRTIAVLGGMAELGPVSAAEHERAGELIVRLGIDVVITVGSEGARIASGAEREGIEPERAVRCDDVATATEALREIVRRDDVVLVKASRVEGLDRVAAALRHGGAASFAEAARTGS